MKVSQPKVLLGFKERDPDVSGTPLLRRQMETSIAMAAAFGRASDFYQRFYAEGLIDDSFYGTYSADPGLAFSLFSADTDAPEAFVDRVLERIETVRRRGIDEADFLRILRRIRGRFLRNFNHPETVAFSLLSHSLRDSSLFSVLDVLQELDTGGVDRRMGEHFDTALSARSILVPAEAGGQAHHQP